MTLFLSYAHQDLDVVTSLRRDLEDLGQTVWLDESLHGGQIWWEEILRQVRQCNGFVLAVSATSLASEACLAEWEYAVDLARPFLPV
ncbi:MAG TPA: toll/interleukin-1 receptor domain-containing protein, partial [Ilumatobacteraceae bacterium]